jgi:outer membrane murein-binding lipoprotein Lpp
MRNPIGAALPLSILYLAGCQDTRVSNLEQRVNHLEQSVHELESQRDKHADDDQARRQKLEACVAEANAEFDRNIAGNGTKLRNGTYNVPVPVVTEMQRQKQGKIDECRLLYGK